MGPFENRRRKCTRARTATQPCDRKSGTYTQKTRGQPKLIRVFPSSFSGAFVPSSLFFFATSLSKKINFQK